MHDRRAPKLFPHARQTLAALCLGIAWAASPLLHASDEEQLVLPGNMMALSCAMPSESYRLLSGASGFLYLPDEPAVVRLSLHDPVGPFALAVHEITQRDPRDRITTGEGRMDTTGDPHRIAVVGTPSVIPLSPSFSAQGSAELSVDLQLGARYGTYALVVVHGPRGERHFLGTVARVPAPSATATVEDAPIFGEGQFFRAGDADARAQTYARMGIRGWRCELGWNEPEGGLEQVDWSEYDRLFGAAQRAGCRIMVTLGAVGAAAAWSRPFGATPVPAANWTPASAGYGGTGDWMMEPRHYARYGHWVEALCRRYWQDGAGPLWGLENYNEPWEGGGISGWARDVLQYRELQQVIAEAARRVSPGIRILAASSIMNTEDKLYSDGSDAMSPFIDIFSDHYVIPRVNYGPLVAAARGKESMETESWFVGAEHQVAQALCQLMACGQARVTPFHPRVLYGAVPGIADPQHVPLPVTVAIAAFNHLVAGRRFTRIVFREHLPWVFQFGADDDAGALLVVFGRLSGIATDDPKDMVWAQVEAAAGPLGETGGVLHVDNGDGMLSFFDLAANPIHLGDARVDLPMDIYPHFITCAAGPKVAAERLRTASLEGRRPVEIVPRDFTTRIADGVTLDVDLRNRLNRSIAGTLTATAPPGWALAATTMPAALAAGESRRISFRATTAPANAGNSYPFAFAFASDAGAADYAEALHAAVAPKLTPIVDGDLAEWAAIPSVTLMSRGVVVDRGELMRRPWTAAQAAAVDATVAEFRLAWDDEHLYLGARVRDATPESDRASFARQSDDWFFHSATSDGEEPYRTFLAAHPGLTFAQVPYVWRRSPEENWPVRRDRVQFALDVDADPATAWHDLTPDTDRVPLGFHAYPDSDHEFAAYLVNGRDTEVWRYLGPGMPRVHCTPRQPRADVWPGSVTGAVAQGRLVDGVYTYELALPRSELSGLELDAGTTFGLALRAGDQANRHADLGPAKAACKNNGLTLHPYWESKCDSGVRWTLIDR